ncbi:MAG: acetoin dehydrogenase dihydrolipoyllysine-residue acetyltransferase subunit [Alphaproteobacteria bacterium]|nr:acetoin dehydrogenase dihydrolipoyllysine-residue acetyltransferase subunit [Alphaproteobacteria bacterium]
MSAIQPITMPKWGLSMREGLVAQWNVAEGAVLRVGDEIAEIETTKITNVFESPVAGQLRRRIAKEGEAIPVQGLLAVVADAAVPEAEIDAFVLAYQAEFGTRAAAAAADEPQPELLTAGGRALRFLKLGEGDGTPAVFIHGFGGNLNSWLFNQPAVAAGRATYAFDLPGHGGSTKAVGAGDLGALAGALADFLGACAIERAHLVGHSLGGAIALALALGEPARVASLTLIGSAGLGPDINMGYIESFIAANRRKEMKAALSELFADPALVSTEMVNDVLKYKRIDGVEAALRAIAGSAFAGGRQAAVLTARLGELAAPAQCIWGTADRIVPVEHAAHLPASITVHRLAGAGHMVHMERAGDVNKLIDAFAGA